MATVTVEINGRPYAVGCADGQEERVRALATQFDASVRQVASSVGSVGDIRLFLMAGLLLADDLHEARLTLEGGARPDSAVSPSIVPNEAPAPAGLAEALNAAAARIEKIAAAL